jgi:hypothetical protein
MLRIRIDPPTLEFYGPPKQIIAGLVHAIGPLHKRQASPQFYSRGGYGSPTGGLGGRWVGGDARAFL